MDEIDRKILNLLQKDATLSTAEIAEAVGLSTTPCWRRIQILEQEGYITRRVALVDRNKINVPLDVFVAIRTNEHNFDWLDEFARLVCEFPEVVELYRMSGEIDYLMRVVVPDMAAYDTFYKKLIKRVQLTDVSSSFAMERIKYTTALPLDYAIESGRSRRKRG
ncbi:MULTISPECIES: Lrp/AsnC family transcriptional regulator [Kordiimonas]|jgi:Lrp/AsnC family transcriptional regulator|uniref:Lrp/AsnC family transcriptional regulator n=1 Tax=Kordiimonas lacus TaxID=637679 RepID=A0A1G6W2U1_9PROT|nr:MULTISPECIES: Lrp/AsnC family transcriptional regulator [Kordiimonas]SDD59366.1 Lrp/AsnC family transcriptional regulator [Kordiimonas lacus]